MAKTILTFLIIVSATTAVTSTQHLNLAADLASFHKDVGKFLNFQDTLAQYATSGNAEYVPALDGVQMVSEEARISTIPAPFLKKGKGRQLSNTIKYWARHYYSDSACTVSKY